MTTDGPIIHPTDFSRASTAAFMRAIDVAKRDGAQLVLVHVFEPISPSLAESRPHYNRYHELQASLRATARVKLERMLARAKRAGVAASDLLLEGFSPAEGIVGVAKDRRARVIVMGTRGRTALKTLLLGSVAARVIGLAPCPVMTVRGGQ